MRAANSLGALRSAAVLRIPGRRGPSNCRRRSDAGRWPRSFKLAWSGSGDCTSAAHTVAPVRGGRPDRQLPSFELSFAETINEPTGHSDANDAISHLGSARTPDASLPSMFDLIAGVSAIAPVANPVASRARAAALAFGLLFTVSVSDASVARIYTITCPLPANIRTVDFISLAQAQPPALTKSQVDALNAYHKAVRDFRSILDERQAQIRSNQP